VDLHLPARSREIDLLVAIPALNEAATLGSVVRGIPRDLPGVRSVEILVVDDGSNDETAQVAAGLGATVIRHGATRGVGAAFHTGLAYGIERGADLIVSLDADGQFDPRDVAKLIHPVMTGEADFATGSRFLDPSLVPEMPRIKRWGNRVMSRLISHLAGRRFHDVSCGMRCYSRAAALQLHLLGRFTYTQEALLNLAFKQLRIVEVPVQVRGERQFGESRVAHNVWSYGIRSARIIFRAYRDYHPIRVFGGLAVGLALPGIGLLGFLLWHYLQTGSMSPHKWAGFLGGGFLVLSLMLLHLGLIGDMLTRHRIYLEELLYRQRAGSR
jgi:glycosyltransferase involved in cell wall biosynthesis